MDKQAQFQDILKKYNYNPSNYSVDGSQPEQQSVEQRLNELKGIASQNKRTSFTGLESAPFQATGEENILTGTAKTVGNLPKSGLELGKSIFSAVVNPIDTLKSVKDIVKGTGAKVAELAFEKTDIGQGFLSKINEDRISKGLPPLKQDEQGRFQVEDTEDLKTVNQLGNFFKDRYGSLEKFKETAIEDPASVLADISTVFTGGAGALSKAGEISNVAKTVSKAVEPLNVAKQIAKTTTGGIKTLKDTTAGRVVSEVIPTSKDIQRSQVVKALDLTQGDLSNIQKLTGNDVTDFVIKKNALKDTPEQISDFLEADRKTLKQSRNDVISGITKKYNQEEIPQLNASLNVILEDLKGVSGLENEVNKISNLLAKKQYSLEDIQLAKDLIDDNSAIYSKIGDVKSTSKAKGLDNNRKAIRKFIEDEVERETNGQVDIRNINNELQTSFAIQDAIDTRATRNLTRQKLSLGDSVVLFGGGATFSPAVGIGLYLGKKLIETPSFRLAFVKALNSQPINKVKKIVTEIKNKTVSSETQKLLNQLADEAKNNLGVIESGSQIIEDKTTSETEQ